MLVFANAGRLYRRSYLYYRRKSTIAEWGNIVIFLCSPSKIVLSYGEHRDRSIAINFKTFTCPNYNSAKYQCESSGSYIFKVNGNYTNFSNVKIKPPQKSQDQDESGKYSGIFVLADTTQSRQKNYRSRCSRFFTGFVFYCYKLLRTIKTLLSSAHVIPRSSLLKNLHVTSSWCGRQTIASVS